MTKIATSETIMQNLVSSILKLKQQWCSDNFDTSVVIIKLMHSHLLLLTTIITFTMFFKEFQSCYSTFSSFM